MFSRFLLIFLFGTLFCTCTSVSSVKDDQTTDKKLLPVNDDEEKKPEPALTDTIVLKDFNNDAQYSLSQLSMGRPVFMEISASWCEACRDLAKLTEKLKEYYKNAFFFVRVYLPGDLPGAINEDGNIALMEVVDSPAELSLEKSDVFPKVIIFGRGGKKIEAELDGIFPILVYHGIMGNL